MINSTGNNQAPTDFLFIRHGETDRNVIGLVQGWADIPLNETGIGQAERLAARMVVYHRQIANVMYASDLSRAIVTAKKTALAFRDKHAEIKAIVSCEELREINSGVVDGLHVSIKERICREGNERWDFMPIEGAESSLQLVQRIMKALRPIAKEHPNEKVAVFCHGRLINCLKEYALGRDQIPAGGLPNCGVVHFRYTPGQDRPISFLEVEDLLNKPL